MKTLLTQALGSAVSWTRATGMMVIGIGAADAWHFHSFGTSTDLVMIVGAASALGVHLATSASSATAAAATTPPQQGA